MLRNVYTPLGNVLDLLGIPNFLKADNRLTQLGESIADLLGEKCAFSGLIGNQLYLGKVLLNLVLLCGELR